MAIIIFHKKDLFCRVLKISFEVTFSQLLKYLIGPTVSDQHLRSQLTIEENCRETKKQNRLLVYFQSEGFQ